MSGPLSELRAMGQLSDAGAQLLYQTVRSVVMGDRLPPPDGHKTWDREAVDEATHDFVAEHLLGKRRIDSLLLRATTEESFARLLRAATRNYFRDQLRQTARGALIRRLGDILDSDTRFRLWVAGATRHGSDSLWGLAVWESPRPFPGLPESLVPAAWRIQGITIVRWRPEAARRSPLADGKSLRRFVEGVLDSAEGLLSIPQLVDVAAYRFSLQEAPAFVDLDDPATAAPPASEGRQPDDVVTARPKAEEIFQQLSDREREVLVRLGEDVRAIGDELGVAKSTIQDTAQRVRAIVRACLDPDDNAASVLRELETLAAGADP